MATINETGFAEKIIEYISYSDRFDEQARPIAFTLANPNCSLEGYFAINDPRPRGTKGIRFGYNTKLAMELIKRAYNDLQDGTDIQAYSTAVARSMQHFAEPFPQEWLVYPHFLLHGLEKQTLDEVINKIENNSRIIHETVQSRKDIMDRYSTIRLDNGFIVNLGEGEFEDYLGIASFLNKNSLCHPSLDYIAKVSFFLDETNKELYVITIQGLRPRRKTEKKNRSRDFARISSALGTDPRTYLLKIVASLARKNYQKIKVIRPHHHPLWIEQHKGFTGKYEPIIFQAGIDQENGCYLEKEL